MAFDPFYYQVSLMLQKDQANASTTFTDESVNPQTVTPTGSVAYTTSFSKFGSSSMDFPAAGSYLTTPTSVWTFGTGDFTIDFWVNMPATTGGGTVFETTNAGSNSVGGLQFLINPYNLGATNNTTVYCMGGTLFNSVALNITVATWTHIALSRVGGTVTLYKNGVVMGTIANSVNIAAGSASIGRRQSDSTGFKGRIENFRVTKDAARYTAAFTPDTERLLPYPPGVGNSSLTYLDLADVNGFTGGASSTTVSTPTLLGYSGGDAQIQTTFSLSADGHDATDENSLAYILGSPILVAEGGANASVTMAMPTVSVTGTFTVLGGAALTLPSAQLSAAGTVTSAGRAGLTFGFANGGNYATNGFGGASAAVEAPSVVVSATGITGNTSTAALSITPTLQGYGGASGLVSAPAATITATGITGSSGTASLTMPRSMNFVVGYSGAVCSVNVGGITLAATGSGGGAGSVAITLPLYQLAATGTVNGLSFADLTSPTPALGSTARAALVMPFGVLTAIGHAVVAVTYEAYALNLNHNSETPTDEMTRYTNYPFDRIVRYQNSYFGMNSTGLYLLEGATDDAVPIDWTVQTAFTDFDSPQLKTVEMAYFGGRLGPAATVSLLVSENNTKTYTYATPRDTDAQNYRQTFGRGNKARYYAMGATGSGDMSIDSITFNVASMARKV